jgi:ribosomal-protein-alanine N-acetyltransferase
MLSFCPFSDTSLDNIYAIEVASNPSPWSKKVLKSCLGGRYFNQQAMLGDQLIGFYIGEQVVDEITLMEICIAPQFQGKGYGKALFKAFLAEAKQRGGSQCFLEVRASNIAAQMLYINQGFIQTGRRTGYYQSQTGYEDALLMSAPL